MDKKILFLGVIAAIVLFGIVFFIFLAPAGGELQKLNSLNSSAGLENKPLNQQTEQLLNLSNDKLVFLKNDLQGFNLQTGDPQAKAISSLYIDIVDSAFLFKTSVSLNNSIDASKDFCQNIPVFRQINDNLGKLEQNQEKITAKIKDFLRKNPELSTQIGLALFKPLLITTTAQEQSRQLDLAAQGC